MRKRWIGWSIIVLIVLLTGFYLLFKDSLFSVNRSRKVMAFLRRPVDHGDLILPARSRCGEAPFILPTEGMIGFIWDDSFRPGHRHTGIDIFSGKEAGETAIYAAYDGYLTRWSDWKSSLIIRIPSDPLQPDRQIWIYYTHMADPYGHSLIVDDFPPGISEVFVPAGTLLGYQGNYSGTNGKPTGVHLHFSIVKDDSKGGFLNELEIQNTLDPSPYFGLSLNANHNRDRIPLCNQP